MNKASRPPFRTSAYVRDCFRLSIDILLCDRSLRNRKKPPGTVYYTETADSRNLSFRRNHIEPVQIKPAVEDQFRGIVRQAYDYSCGSAALTTLLNGYVGTSLTEQQTMSGLLQYGEYQRIIERRSFSLLDMKRFVTAIGLESGGIEGSFLI